MTARVVLDGIKARLSAATPGPWECDGFADGDVVSLAIFPTNDRADILANCIEKQDDATFFLNAPTDVARLTGAVEAVLGLHFAEGDPDHSYADICFECRDTYPCPTVAAIENALEPK